jgi:hypothetical protein
MSVTFEIRYYNTNTLRQREERGEPIDRSDWHLEGRYESGKEAADSLNLLKASHDYAEYTLCIVRNDPAALDRNWRLREMKRLFDGTYKLPQGALPMELPREASHQISEMRWMEHYAGRSFADLLLSAQPDHFAHLSQSDERKIAFTENHQKGQQDKQKTQAAVTYISNQCHHWPEFVQAELLSALGGFNVQLQFVETAEDMVRIYTECNSSRDVGSCMTHDVSDYNSNPVHPVAVYAAGDLQVAYARMDGDSGEIWGRALVWPERKVWGRIYSTNASLFRKALKAAGYESGESSTALVGARLQLIYTDDSEREIVMPYIDGTQSADWDGVRLTIASHGNIEAGSTGGLARLGPEYFCEHCDADINYQAERYDSESGEILCESCYNEAYTRCEECHSETQTHETLYDEHSNRSLCSYCYHERNTNCDECGEDFPRDQVTVSDHDGCDRCEECHEQHEADRETIEEGEQAATDNHNACPAQPAPAPAPVQLEPAPAQIDLTLEPVEIVTDWNSITAPEGFCFYHPSSPLTPPPHWQPHMRSSLWHWLRDNPEPRTGHYWSWDNQEPEIYCYVVPIQAITGRPYHRPAIRLSGFTPTAQPELALEAAA